MSNQKNIWVVDDDPIAVSIVRYLIAGSAHLALTDEFDSAEKLIAQLKLASVADPDLIILDLNMPMMSGWELLDMLGEMRRGSPIPAAVFTSSIDDRDKQRSEKYPHVIGHFVKPMTKALLAEIEEKLASHHQG